MKPDPVRGSIRMSEASDPAAPPALRGAAEPPPLVAGQGLDVRFGDRLVLDHVDIEIRQGEITTVVGLNGSGKSTLARVLLGLVPLQAGTLVKKPGLVIGYVPQTLNRD